MEREIEITNLKAEQDAARSRSLSLLIHAKADGDSLRRGEELLKEAQAECQTLKGLRDQACSNLRNAVASLTEAEDEAESLRKRITALENASNEAAEWKRRAMETEEIARRHVGLKP